MELVRAYSKRADLWEDLSRAVRRLGKAAQATSCNEPLSVRSSGRVGRKWALADRLSEDEVRSLVEGFRAGTPKHKLAKRYSISVSSVKRVLRQQRVAG